MKSVRPIVFFLCISAAVPASAQDAAAVWTAVNQVAFDPAKSASVSNLVLERDRIRITLKDGTIQFTQPAAGIVFGAAFRGHGRLQVSVPNPRERQQLQFLTKQDSLDLEFTEAVISFTDGTYEEVARQVKWSASPEGRLADLYQNRQREREDIAAEIVPRIFQGVLSTDHARTAYFGAEVKTGEKGWVLARYDALEPEEIDVGRWADRGSFKFFDTWLSFPAGNHTSSEAFQDPLAKEEFLVRGYQIDARVTGGAELMATTKTHLEYRAAGARVLVFDLNANLRVGSVKDDKGTALPYFQPREPKDRFPTYGEYVAVVLPQPTVAGQTQTLEFQYAGKRVIRKVGAGNYFCPSYGWYPGRPNNFATRADFEINFRSPKRLTLVATGSKVSQTNDGNETISTWKSDIPLAVAGFAFGDYKVLSQKVGSIDVQIFANREPDEFLSAVRELLHPSTPGGEMREDAPTGNLDPTGTIKTMSIEIANCLKLFQDYFGPYPYKTLSVTNIPYFYGQGWPSLLYLSSLSFLDSTQRDILGIRDQVELTDFFRGHETSHQWWGHRVGWKSYHDQWLSEGFAQFSGNLYVQIRENPKEYFNQLRKDRQALLNKNPFGHVYDSLGPVWMGNRLASSSAPDGFNVVIYRKGGYLVHTLRMMLSDARSPDIDKNFKAMMQDLCQTYENKPASTEDFKAIVEKHMAPWMDAEGNHRMDWFFNEYVYGTGIPHYTFEYATREVDGKWQVTGTIVQSGVPEGWKDILPVFVHVPGRTVRLGWLRVTGKNTPVQFTVPVKPDKITLNDYEDILAEIKQ